jgi:hypothetical protein
MRGVVTILVLCSLPAMLFPLGKKEAPREEAARRELAQDRAEPVSRRPLSGGLYDTALTGQEVELTGRVRLVGSEPFPELILADGEDHLWYIARESRKILAGYEQRIVTVRGRVELREMVLADGRRLEDRRVLAELTLIR